MVAIGFVATLSTVIPQGPDPKLTGAAASGASNRMQGERRAEPAAQAGSSAPSPVPSPAKPTPAQEDEAAAESGSPTEVTALHTAAESQQSSSGAATPLTDARSAVSSGGDERQRPASPALSLGTISEGSSPEAQQGAAGPASTSSAAAAAASPQHRQQQQAHAAPRPSPGRAASAPAASALLGGRPSGGAAAAAVDIPSLVQRLKQRPISSQVAAWGWDAAARVAAVRRTLPAQLSSALWPATEACMCRMMPQDVLEILESWLALMQHCPRHFCLSLGVLEGMAAFALPAAVKRMGERQLAQLAQAARDIALHRSDADLMHVSGSTRQGASARDLVQPFFALAAAEVAWRCNNPSRYVSPETVSAIVTAASAWSWRVVRHRDSQALASLKLATAAALEELRPFSPSDLSPTAFRKLTADGSVRTASSVGGSSVAGGGSGSTTPRHLAA